MALCEPIHRASIARPHSFALVRRRPNPYRCNDFCPPSTVLDPRQAMKEIIGRGMGV
jgi:hypothetical protein